MADGQRTYVISNLLLVNSASPKVAMIQNKYQIWKQTYTK